MTTLAAGTRLGRYEIRSKLGEGGMAEVYLAVDTKLDRRVALKMLPVEVASNDNRMRRFVQEAKAASALNHPNIITIHEIDETESGHFIATEFIEGQTLRDRFRRAPITLSDVLDVAIQIAGALSAAHAAGIMHRDVKPENVMIRQDGIVKVLDFGLAKLTEPANGIDTEAPTRANIKTDPGIVMGTAIYMSPEQARGLSMDARTDIFSLGVVLYEMVAGRLPFDGSNRNEIIASVLSDKEPQPVTRYSSEAPSELGRIISKALRKNPDERYQTIKDMLLDLRSLQQQLEFEHKLASSASDARSATVERGALVTEAEMAAGVAAMAPQMSSAEYIISGIKQHRRTTAIVAVVLLVAVGLGMWFLIRGPANAGTIDSIAVLPFENVTREQNQEYLSDGVTESLINSLSQLPNIKVIARNSVFSYKGQAPKVADVARQLNVRAVLTGRVLMQGDTLDVRAELTDAQTHAQLWGDHYTRKVSDIFAVQDEIARQVTNALRVRLSSGQEEQVMKRSTQNAQAYQLYLQGRYYMNELSSEQSVKRALSFFDQAIALDPRFAQAYAARGNGFFYLADGAFTAKEATEKARGDVITALSIDPTNPEARTNMANIEYQYDWNYAKAEEDFRRVIAANPNYAEGHRSYGFLLSLLGRTTEGNAEMRLAQQLDPMNPQINTDLNLSYFCARQYEQSIAESRKALALFPNYFLPHMTLGQVLIETGDYAEGMQELQKAKALDGTPTTIGTLGYGLAKAGRKEEARKVLADLKEQSKTRYVAPYWYAVIHAPLGEKEEALAALEQAYQERSWWICWMKTDPKMDSLRSDSRFTDLVRRIRFPQ